MDGPWRLVGFEAAIEAWRGIAAPTNDSISEVLDWLLGVLRYNAYPPGSGWAGDPWPITTWFARTSVQLADMRRVVCVYDINTADRTLTCKVIADLTDPI